MQRFCLTLDLKNDPALIAEYERYHEQIPAEIEASIKNSGIIAMQIFRLDTRMFMIIDANDDFSFERKAAMDASNPHVQAWEELMWKFQEPLPQAKAGEKWLLMNQIFEI
jgi:L-rhamnose mutarotase